MSTIIPLALIGGPIIGIVSLNIAAGLTAWTGKWLGGTAPATQIATAMAWANVPVVVGLLIWVGDLALFGSDMFTTETPRLEGNLPLALLMVLSGVVSITLGIWTIVLLLKGVGEAQGFSAWKALGNVLLSILVVVVPLVVLVMGFIVLVDR